MLGLTLLLTTAAAAMDRLCLARFSRASGVLTPEYLDPSLELALEGPVCGEAATARQNLACSAAQLQVAGAAASAMAILAQADGSRRQLALLALAGGTGWQATARVPGGGELHRRPAADGQVYLLAGAPAAGAAHAPHAVRAYAERLWILPAGHPSAAGHGLPAKPPAMMAEGPDSLSLDAGLRDLLLRLTAAGETALAAQVAALRQGAMLPLPEDAAQPGPLAPAVAA